MLKRCGNEIKELLFSTIPWTYVAAGKINISSEKYKYKADPPILAGNVTSAAKEYRPVEVKGLSDGERVTKISSQIYVPLLPGDVEIRSTSRSMNSIIINQRSNVCRIDLDQDSNLVILLLLFVHLRCQIMRTLLNGQLNLREW